MSNKSEILTVIRFFRKRFLSWIKTADKETLRILASEIGQMKRAIAGRLKE